MDTPLLLVLGCKVLHRFEQCFLILNISRILFWTLFIIGLKLVRNIVWLYILFGSEDPFRFYNLIGSSMLCEMIHHCKEIFKLIWHKVWKKNCASLAYFSWLVDSICFTFTFFLGSKKEDFILFFKFYEACTFLFPNESQP